MFEEPQYLTPDGFKRKKKPDSELSLFEQIQQQKKALKAQLAGKPSVNHEMELSDEAAAAIGKAISAMLKSDKKK
ncbi:MAG: hypothetical protein MUF22_08585 [Chitinispirillaceae bacterium]|jgi:hypothetical protein|nr:hypothetical protein [Chitinispirillaceae bacterium]